MNSLRVDGSRLSTGESFFHYPARWSGCPGPREPAPGSRRGSIDRACRDSGAAGPGKIAAIDRSFPLPATGTRRLSLMPEQPGWWLKEPGRSLRELPRVWRDCRRLQRTELPWRPPARVQPAGESSHPSRRSPPAAGSRVGAGIPIAHQLDIAVNPVVGVSFFVGHLDRCRSGDSRWQASRIRSWKIPSIVSLSLTW